MKRMSKTTFIAVLLIGLMYWYARSVKAQGQFNSVGVSVTNFPVTGGTNLCIVAPMRDNLAVNGRQIINTNAASDLIIWAIKIVSNITPYITSNVYVSGTTTNVLGLQTNVPNDTIVSTLPLLYKLCAITANTGSNLNIGSVLYGGYTNAASPLSSTSTVWETDQYLQR